MAHPAFQICSCRPSSFRASVTAAPSAECQSENPIWAAHVTAVKKMRRAHPIRNDGTRPRAGPFGPLVGLGDRRASAVEHSRRSVGSDLQHPMPRQPASGHDYPPIFSTVVAASRDEVLDLVTSTASRPSSSEPDSGLDAGTGSASSPRYRVRRGPSLPAPRKPDSVFGPVIATGSRFADSQRRGAPGLWPFGISGDLPIVLVRIDETEDIDIVRQLLHAHEYWRLKLLDVDLVIINEHGPTYAQLLHDSLETLVRTSHPIPDDHPGQGRVFILRGEQLSDDDRTLLQSAARAVLLSRRGTLADQVIRLERTEKIAVPTCTGSEAAEERGRRAAAGAGVLQWPRWVRRRRARVRHDARPRPVHACTVAERDCQSDVRLSGLGIGVGVHVVRKQSREPAHPVVQRPGQRPGQ